MKEDTMDEGCERFFAYFGVVEIRRSAAKSQIVVRNYLLQRISQFQVDGVITNVSHTHNYIFGLAPSHHRLYTLRIDSFFVYSLNLDDLNSANRKFERLINVTLETEPMCGAVSCNDGQVAELAHCYLQHTEERMKSNVSEVEDFLICTTSRSCFLARNTPSNESSIYRIFSDNKINDFQLLQFGSAELIRQLSAGNDHILILTVSGRVYSMGTGSRGELGHGTVECEQQPKLVESLTPLTIIQVACGGWHSVALTDDGNVYLWGWNKCGQLSDCCEVGEVLDIPVPLNIDESVVGIAAQGNGTWLKLADQSVFTLGSATVI
ncbi:unnamed protein product [Litomosoides sigmodontis]|uniref:Uncharacterized protein n=1 Tax=Litomosoides sigmodontis TaxID=42156 RepID=A0A3P6TZ14_LITSI|nr:unnamed protein product [Litomosoides sigmodontis]